jgi:hypothetical protein
LATPRTSFPSCSCGRAKKTDPQRRQSQALAGEEGFGRRNNTGVLQLPQRSIASSNSQTAADAYASSSSMTESSTIGNSLLVRRHRSRLGANFRWE